MKLFDVIFQTAMWRSVFKGDDSHGVARRYLLFSTMAQAAVSGLTTGVFYSGYLSSYGINIVGLSILTLLPHFSSLFSLLAPIILERVERRRLILTVLRGLYYVTNILGTSLLPLIITGEQARMMGLIFIVLLSNMFNALTLPGYSAWHMPYVDKFERSGYFTATTLVSTAFSGFFAVAAGFVTDLITGSARLTVFLACRCLAFFVALLDIYFMQKPPEPVYQHSYRKRPSLVQVLVMPLRCRRFALAMGVHFMVTLISNLINSVIDTWLVQDVRVRYSFISAVNLSKVLFILPTSVIWRKVMKKKGTFSTLSISIGFSIPALFLHAFMTHENYLIIMLLVKLIQNFLSLGSSISEANLIYLSTPEKDQICYLSFYQILTHAASLLGMSIGTWVVAAMGKQVLFICGFSFTSVPVLLLSQGVLYLLLIPYMLRTGRELEPEYSSCSR